MNILTIKIYAEKDQLNFQKQIIKKIFYKR